MGERADQIEVTCFFLAFEVRRGGRLPDPVGDGAVDGAEGSLEDAAHQESRGQANKLARPKKINWIRTQETCLGAWS